MLAALAFAAPGSSNVRMAAAKGAGMAKVRRSGIYRLLYDRSGGEDGRRDDADRQTVSLAGLAVTLVVLVVCLFLVKQLSRTARLDDCLLSGRTNCDLLIARIR